MTVPLKVTQAVICIEILYMYMYVYVNTNIYIYIYMLLSLCLQLTPMLSRWPYLPRNIQ